MTGRPTALPRAIGEDVLSCSSGTVGAPLAGAIGTTTAWLSLPLLSPHCCSGVGGRARDDRRQKAKGGVSKRHWILHKKERARAQGKDGVKPDTKCGQQPRRHALEQPHPTACSEILTLFFRYTGRQRPRF